MTDPTEWTVERHLAGQPEFAVDLYRQFVAVVADCGRYTLAVARTTITFKGVRRGFAGARPKTGGLYGYLDLQREVFDPRLSKPAPYTKRLYVHHFHVARPEEMDDEFAGWVAEAYAVGQGAHLS